MSDVTRQRQNLKVLSQESQLYTERNEKAWMGFTEEVLYLGFPGGSDGKESACNTGDPGSIPGSGRSLGEGNGNPLQYSCWKNPMERTLKKKKKNSQPFRRSAHTYKANSITP